MIAAALLIGVPDDGMRGEIFERGYSLAGTRDGNSPVSVHNLTLSEAAGQMLVIGFRGDVPDTETMNVLQDIRPGGIVLFDHDLPSRGKEVRNITSPEQLRALTQRLQESARTPYLIAIDAEGGFANRLQAKYGFSGNTPSAQTMGARSSTETKDAARALARELSEMGIRWNFAPVIDVAVNPESPAIGALERSFGDDPDTVVRHASAFVEAHKEQGIIPTLKHFPGHGSATGDTHLGVVDVTATYQSAEELAPYRALIENGYGDPIMTAHIINRNLDRSGRPATLSFPILTGLLRNEMGFGGIIVSDDIQMGAITEQYGLEHAVVSAIQAGVDVIVVANQIGEYDIQSVYRVRDAILRAVESGDLTEERVRESANRILNLKNKYVR